MPTTIPPHLLALAARLEGDGQINLSKLLRAALAAEARRAAYAAALPEDSAALPAALDQAIEALAARDTDPALLAALRAGQAALNAGRLALYAETPDPYVCRVCGQVRLDPPAAPCPTCGAAPETFERFRPVWWLTELDPPAGLARLRATLPQVQALVGDLSDEALAHEPRPGAWSLRLALTHLRDAQQVLATRTELILNQDDPVLAALAIFDWAEDEKPAAAPALAPHPASARALLALYADERARLLARLEGLPLAAFWRTGRHEEFGRVTLGQQLSYFAAHESDHLRQMTALAKEARA